MSRHKHYQIREVGVKHEWQPLGRALKQVCPMCLREFIPDDPKHFLCSFDCVEAYRALRSRPRRAA